LIGETNVRLFVQSKVEGKNPSQNVPTEKSTANDQSFYGHIDFFLKTDKDAIELMRPGPVVFSPFQPAK
jgi:hypothetical protein